MSAATSLSSAWRMRSVSDRRFSASASSCLTRASSLRLRAERETRLGRTVRATIHVRSARGGELGLEGLDLLLTARALLLRLGEGVLAALQLIVGASKIPATQGEDPAAQTRAHARTT